MNLVDVSVLTRLTRPDIAEALTPLIDAGVVATCATVDLQLYAGLTDPARYAEVHALRTASFAWLPTDDADLRTALATQQSLLAIGESAPWPSLVVAAVAGRHHATVLHHDPAFDQIAKLTGQPITWVVPQR